jgi:L-sorbose 1-phosphate reductase
MSKNKYKKYISAWSTIPEKQLGWPLFGAGLENLGIDGKPVEIDIPKYSDNELLMRIDAVSLCYTDLKEIDSGDDHPRLAGRNLKKNPIIPGHEVSLTVIAVGDNLRSEYRIGDRYTLQPDIWAGGKSIPFSFGMDGGYRQYTKVGKEILEGDAGNYLIPVPDDISYSASAITEPWACVEASYRAQYRDVLKKGGSAIFVGGKNSRSGYSIDEKWLSGCRPGRIFISNIPEDLKELVSIFCKENDVPLKEINADSLNSPDDVYDDIITLDCNYEEINHINDFLNKGGVLAIMGSGYSNERVTIDLGRLHYDMIYYVGSTGLEINQAYEKTLPRAGLKKNGKTWIIGAGGPMGRLHLQRAIEDKDGPGLIVASEITEDRYKSMTDFFVPLAKKCNKELIAINPQEDSEEYERIMSEIKDDGGFDDIPVMVAVPKIIEESVEYAGAGSVINLFAGLQRGVKAKIPINSIIGTQQIRLIGHSGSDLSDQKVVVDRITSRRLNTDLSVAAIGGINQIADGIKAMKNWVFPGKIVIYPHVLEFHLTAIDKLEEKIPGIGKYLGEDRAWNMEAEKFFLEKML